MGTKGQHTPGPWKLHPEHRTQVYNSHADMPDVAYNLSALIADCCTLGDRSRNAECLANARLIAAAPDLLEACRYALVRLEVIERDKGVHSHETIPELRAAIAKAEGGTP